MKNNVCLFAKNSIKQLINSYVWERCKCTLTSNKMCCFKQGLRFCHIFQINIGKLPCRNHIILIKSIKNFPSMYMKHYWSALLKFNKFVFLV